MTDQRPVALTVLPENIPDELKALPIWACWRYKRKGDRWTKVPYTPFTTDNARSNAPSTWRTFDQAYACYLERNDFFDGIFICLQESDPYTGGDFDHDTDLSRVPHTYTELSPSGEGVRFIGRGTIPSACKKPQGELYNKKRFLSITGHRLEGAPAVILPIQEALDKLYEELKGRARAIRQGAPGSGARSDLVKLIPDEDWKQGRFLMRTQIGRLLARLRASATSKKTGKDDTQLGCLLRFAYREFAERWPYANIVRGDGSIDSSQIRACMASSIRSRGFTFPQYAALMGHFYGAECLAKWGTKERFQEELAALWFHARTPRAAEGKVATAAARGRASNHQELLDRTYAILLTYRVGVQAVASLQDIADDLGVHRSTASTLLSELQEAGRITHRQLRQYAGILIEFTGFVYSQNGTGDLEHTDKVNAGADILDISADTSAPELHSGFVYSENYRQDLGDTEAEYPALPFDEISAETDDDGLFPGFAYSSDDGTEDSAQETEETQSASEDDKRDEAPPALIYKEYSTVYLLGSTAKPENQESASYNPKRSRLGLPPKEREARAKARRQARFRAMDAPDLRREWIILSRKADKTTNPSQRYALKEQVAEIAHYLALKDAEFVEDTPVPVPKLAPTNLELPGLAVGLIARLHARKSE